MLESSNKISKCYSHTDAAHKFNNVGIRSWSRVEHAAWKSPKLRTCSSANNEGKLKIIYTHPKNFETILVTFHFTESVLVFLNPTPITQSNTNLKQNKIQPPLALSSTKKTEGKVINPWGNTRKSWALLPPLNIRNKKIKTKIHTGRTGK